MSIPISKSQRCKPERIFISECTEGGRQFLDCLENNEWAERTGKGAGMVIPLMLKVEETLITIDPHYEDKWHENNECKENSNRTSHE
ncbi:MULTISPECIES: hypothetical protein [Enterobacteriaceae]|uniref:hypothetical protein n=1 Tax=Enterobacteriaceae TaxID=543 RepID=UPI00193D50A1|nr:MULTISPECIES: hypothetical protein [Enterobacteriaceae]MDT7062913.1 hypothetical protein [Citrobacter braakii]HCR3999094.1 hypothetical protein [Citrobacter freundii]HDJ9421626.1 hypothetical protein [Escherichia coli]HDL8516979.1 hypothetical protein [Yersinia enterocolitica]